MAAQRMVTGYDLSVMKLLVVIVNILMANST